MQDTVYPIELEYYDLVGNATIRLEWSSRSQPREVTCISLGFRVKQDGLGLAA
jgi:hypothetical protein